MELTKTACEFFTIHTLKDAHVQYLQLFDNKLTKTILQKWLACSEGSNDINHPVKS